MSLCCTAGRKNGKHQWYTGRKETTIWEFDKPKKNGDHPNHEADPAAGLSHRQLQYGKLSGA